MNEKVTTISTWLGTGSINIFGRPFSGKDTQGEILIDLLHAELIGGGDIIRSYHDQGKIAEVMAQGGLIPSDFYLQVVLPYLSQENLKDKPLVLSSVGRLHGEEDVIVEATNSSGHPIKSVIVLNISEDEVWKRFEISQQQQDRGNRQDDTRTALENRLHKFSEKTQPVIDYYDEKNLVTYIDGTLSEEQVTSLIIDSLYSIAVSS